MDNAIFYFSLSSGSWRVKVAIVSITTEISVGGFLKNGGSLITFILISKSVEQCRLYKLPLIVDYPTWDLAVGLKL